MKYFRDILGTMTKNGVDVVRLTKNVRFSVLNNTDYLINYHIKDGETPESVANSVYGDYDFWWIVMLSASITNRFEDWPRTDKELTEYINWLISEGEITDTPQNRAAVKLDNDNKRSITILDSIYLADFMFEVERIINR